MGPNEHLMSISERGYSIVIDTSLQHYTANDSDHWERHHSLPVNSNDSNFFHRFGLSQEGHLFASNQKTIFMLMESALPPWPFLIKIIRRISNIRGFFPSYSSLVNCATSSHGHACMRQ